MFDLFDADLSLWNTSSVYVKEEAYKVAFLAVVKLVEF